MTQWVIDPPIQVGLILDWSNMGKQHLNWILPRIPQTKDLSLVRFFPQGFQF